MPSKSKPSPQAFQILEEAEIPITDLIDDPDNVNIHTEENLAAIQASLEAFGQPERLIVRKSDGVVYAGNGRLEVMRRLGWETARIQYVEGTQTQVRAYAIAANQTTRLSRFDDEALLDTLKDIRDADLTGLLAATGFNPDDLADMQRHLEEHAKKALDKLPRGQGGSTATCPKCNTTFQLGATE